MTGISCKGTSRSATRLIHYLRHVNLAVFNSRHPHLVICLHTGLLIELQHAFIQEIGLHLVRRGQYRHGNLESQSRASRSCRREVSN